VLQQQGDLAWAYNILHLNQGSKEEFMKLNEHDLNKAVHFFNQKQTFDRYIDCELQETFKKIERLFDTNLKKAVVRNK
jgi:hypothetical protein